MTDKNRNQTITLLHLSDMQFGEHHRFGVKTDTPDAALATLSACLLQDLDSLRQNHGLKPDILLLTGDLTEQGQKTEFEDFYRFADGLTSALELPRSQVVIVPGNHDIHWRKCRHYFENCKDDGEESRPPYWEKWFFYKRFFDLFYRDEPGIQFTEEEPWSWFEIESLKTVVAGLNSTMRESHRDHYGWTGESQLRWFKDKLENYRQQGWLRIAAIHHNIQRGAENDNENLRDADDLERMLDDSVHLLLHGHTHRGKLGWWNPGLPLLAAGSAALKKEIRPGDHPNQYQLIQIYPDKLLRWCRAFIPEQKIWKPDNRVHTAGETAYQETHVSFTNVQAALPAEQPKMPGDGISAGHRAPVRMHSDHDTFLARVEEICRLRNADAKIITRQGQHTDIPYLHVYAKEGEIVRSYPLGMAGQSVSLEMLDKFSQQVVNKYRSGDPLLISYLVYNGKRAPEELIRIAARQRIRLLSFIEYQELIDFRHYLERQTQKLRDDPVYPPDLYVPQQLRRQLGQDESMVEEALPRLQKWLEELKGRFVLVLGDFGTGKTFLLHELARTLGEAQNPGLIPILLEMRSLKKTNNLDRLAAQQLASDENLSFTPKKFRYMLEQGRIALLFDGFDELVQEEGSYARAAKYLDTLLEAAQGEQARIIVTSRTQHFLSDKQIKQNLLEKVDILARHRIVHLQTFSHAQIQTYLENRLKDKQAAAARYLLLDEIKDLLGLSENPRMLSFIADLPERDLREAKARDSVITTTKLYQLILDRWLDFEQERADDGRKDQLALRWRAVIKLALLLRGKTGCVEGLPLKGDSMPLDIFRPFVKTKDAMVLKALSTAFLDSLSDKDYTGLKEQTTALLSIDTTPELFRAMRECSKHETTKRWYGALYWLLSQSSAVESDRIPDALLLDQTWQTARNADGQASLDVFLGAAGKLSESIAVSCGGQSKRIVAEGKWAMFNLWKVLPDSLQIRVPENLPVLYFQGPQWQPREDLDNLRTVLPVLREKGLGNIVAVVSFLSEDDQKQSSSDLRQNLQAHAIDLIFLTLRDIQCFVCMKDARHLLLKRLLTEVDLLTVSPYRITGPTADNMFFGREMNSGRFHKTWRLHLMPLLAAEEWERPRC
ncbi:MAG: NACHT domain-containing protein [Gammaproteobacteria bacterium]|nr:NACHT domain-containing protein [Gammaproteobacteria bacterium]